MNSEIKVSVIIPTYKRAKDLKRAVESVINQTMRNIEVIVVDDNSPDSKERKQTELIMDSFLAQDKRVKYIKHAHNMNGSVARNTGIKAAQGIYLAFLDDDDYFLPTKLERNCEVLDALPDVYACVISNCYESRNGKIVRIIEVDEDESPLPQVLSCTYRVGSGSNLFIRKKVMEECNGFNEMLMRHQDYDVEARIYSKYKVKKIYEPLFCVEMCSEHLNIPDLDKAVRYRQDYLGLHQELIKTLPVEVQNRVYADNNLSLCELAIRNKRFKEAKYYLAESNKRITVPIKKKLFLIAKCIYAYVPVMIKRHMKVGR